MLESLLRPVANALNENIAAVTPARELCRKLDDTTIAVRIRNTALVAYFRIDDETIALTKQSDADPDVAITTTMLSLARLAANPDADSASTSAIEFSGDIEKAQDFQRLLAYAKPDAEETLAGVVGDAAAHRLGEFARGVSRWASGARETMGNNMREYLQEESRELPSRYEFDKFTGAVNTLRDDVERLAAKIDRLRNVG